MCWASLRALVHEVQAGLKEPEALAERLGPPAAKSLLDALPWGPAPSAEMKANVMDPNFAHCGQRLSPAGREVVIKLSEELRVSELLCWQLLYDASSAPGPSTVRTTARSRRRPSHWTTPAAETRCWRTRSVRWSEATVTV